MYTKLVKLIVPLIFIILIYASHTILASQSSLKIEVKVLELSGSETQLNYSDLKNKLNNLAREIENTAELYQTSNQRAYWKAEGEKSFSSLLRSEGYYSSEIDVELPSQKSNVIIFHIEPWQRYKLANINIRHAKGSNTSVLLPDINEFGIKQVQYAIASDLINVQGKILSMIEKNNCLLSIEVSHSAIINHFDDFVDVTYIVNAGPEASIGEVEYRGLEKVKAEYVDKLVRLEKGQCFKQTYIQDVRSRLQKSGLFASTNPTIPTTTNPDSSVPIIFNLTERKFRSIKAGVSYGTDLGLGARLGWEYRNYFGGGEDLKLDSFINRNEQIAEVGYVEPFYRRDDQKLILGSKFENKKSKAYNNIEGSVFGFLERKYSSKWSGGYGGRFAQSKVKRDKSAQHFSLLSIPIYLKLDTRKNILNPESGHEVRLEAAPFFSVRSKEKPFFKSQFSGSKYFKVETKLSPVIAVRGSFGSILGVRSVKLPINEKFYVGGAQSLRGYEYQLVGELDSKKRPLGGRSFIETSIELRLSMTDTIGIVGFLDSGMAYSAITPNFKLPLMHGAGFGFRYMTNFGPIRADIGFPLKKRKGVDKAFQLYFGIGQSF